MYVVRKGSLYLGTDVDLNPYEVTEFSQAKAFHSSIAAEDAAKKLGWRTYDLVQMSTKDLSKWFKEAAYEADVSQRQEV